MLSSVTREFPIGYLRIVCEDGAVSFVGRVDSPEADIRGGEVEYALCLHTTRQLCEYFDGSRVSFDLPIRASGTPFRRRVWDALCDIPYGQTKSYGELARVIGSPKAARAVGGANHNNPISIIIPCHRVIGADGSLVGYGGGLEMKKYLLGLEAGSRSDNRIERKQQNV